jgi:hypothetical protein
MHGDWRLLRFDTDNRINPRESTMAEIDTSDGRNYLAVLSTQWAQSSKKTEAGTVFSQAL